MDSYNLPPQNLEAEKSLISGMLCNPDIIDDVQGIILPRDFYKPRHRKIYKAILELHDKDNEPVDILTVVEKLKKQDALADVGGAAEIAGISDSPIPAHAKHYAEMVRDKALLRSMIKSCSEAISACHDPRGKAADKINDIQAKIFAVEVHNGNEIKKLGDVLPDRVKHYEAVSKNPGIVTGVPSGFSRLDGLLGGFQPTDLILLAGRPSMGKTAAMVNIGINAATQDYPVLSFSLEMSGGQFIDRHVTVDSGIHTTRIRSGFRKNDWEKFGSSSIRLANLPIYFDDSAGLHYRELEAKARAAIKKYNIRLIMIDYLGFLRGEKSEKTVERIDTISKSLKNMAKKLNVPVILLCQLNRKLEERTKKKPMLSDLRDSGALEQNADVVAFLYREEVYSPKPENKGLCEVIVAKQRNGPTGSVNIRWNAETTKFQNLGGYNEM